mmetsp:Transcript_4838/g.8387  ORF Transcript_4838/g.8387 Transcript_4838/m.8387 type:complete len:104 (+) Transcript_4838:1809-2120(+)
MPPAAERSAKRLTGPDSPEVGLARERLGRLVVDVALSGRAAVEPSPTLTRSSTCATGSGGSGFNAVVLGLNTASGCGKGSGGGFQPQRGLRVAAATIRDEVCN